MYYYYNYKKFLVLSLNFINAFFNLVIFLHRITYMHKPIIGLINNIINFFSMYMVATEYYVKQGFTLKLIQW